MSEPAATKPQPLPIKSEVGVTENSADESSKRPQISKVVVLADLNVDPPETDDDDSLHVSAPDLTRSVLLTSLVSLFLSLFSFLVAEAQKRKLEKSLKILWMRDFVRKRDEILSQLGLYVY